MQVPGGEALQPGESALLCECVPGIQCSKVSLHRMLLTNYALEGYALSYVLEGYNDAAIVIHLLETRL